jgi:mono/diheme cytochrome c family protein
MRTLVIVGLGILAASSAVAADANNGRRLANSHCAACHVVAPQQREEIAVAPPFETIGRKYGFDADPIAQAIRGPHPRMNFSPRPSEAADIAAYIATLRK